MSKYTDSHHNTNLEIEFLEHLPEIHSQRLRRLPKEHFLYKRNSPEKLYQNYLDAMELRSKWQNLDPVKIRAACLELLENA
jgi:hypothetical protein